MAVVAGTALNDIIVYQALGQTANFVISLPAGGFQIISVQVHETAGNTITGGLRIGTTDGGTEVVVAQAVAGNALLVLSDTAIVKKTFGSAQTDIYLQAVTGWNSASLNCAILIGPAA